MKTAYVRKLLAPVVLSLFAVGWYEFSVIYLASNNQLALSSGDLAVYVVPQQFQGYLTATLWICYFVVFMGLAMFWYNLVNIVREEEGGRWEFGAIDLAMPLAIALELVAFFYLGNSLIGDNIAVRLLGYCAVLGCLMWFWYNSVKYVRVREVV